MRELLERLVEEVASLRARVERLETQEPRTPTARAYHDASQSIGNSAWTALALNQERFDTDGIHSLTVNNSRLTCQTAGKYQICGSVGFAGSATGRRVVAIKLAGTTQIAAHTLIPDAGAVYMAISTLYDLAVGDYVELEVIQTSGGNLNVLATGNLSPEFGMVKVG